MIRVTKTKLPYGWISNMSPHPVVYETHTFPTAEHLFIWLRLKNKENCINRILSTNNPMSIKKISKKLIKEKEWKYNHLLLSQEDIDIMELVIKLKMEQYSDLRQVLIDTGDEPIVEDVSARTSSKDSSLFWGAALIGEDNPLIESRWVGFNYLGNLYMQLREELKQ